MSAVFEFVTRSPVARRERRLRLPAAAADRDFAAPVQPETGQRRPESREIPANALLAQLVEHFHGKEGVVGSSPTEGFPCNSHTSWRRSEGRSGVCASTPRPIRVQNRLLGRGRQTRNCQHLRAIHAMVDHFLPAARSCRLGARRMLHVLTSSRLPLSGRGRAKPWPQHPVGGSFGDREAARSAIPATGASSRA